MGDRALVERARHGDRDAYERLATGAADRLFRLAYSIARDIDRAEDAVQQTLVAIWTDLPSLRDPDRFDAWTYRLTVRFCLAESRRHRLLLAPDGNMVFNPVWSPDGTRIALLRYAPGERAPARRDLGRALDLPLLDVIIADVATKEVTDIGVRVASDVNPVSWTPDGEALLVNRYDGATEP